MNSGLYPEDDLKKLHAMIAELKSLRTDVTRLMNAQGNAVYVNPTNQPGGQASSSSSSSSSYSSSSSIGDNCGYVPPGAPSCLGNVCMCLWEWYYGWVCTGPVGFNCSTCVPPVTLANCIASTMPNRPGAFYGDTCYVYYPCPGC